MDHPDDKTSSEQQKINNVEKMTVPFKQKLKSVIFSKNYMVFQGESFVIVYHIVTREKFRIVISNPDFIIVNFPPYVFACIIGQHFYFYPEKALLDPTYVQKCKISKMNVKCLCRYNKGVFLAGYNRSPLPGGNFTNKRSIYYLEDFTTETKNKPLYQISLPKSENPTSILDYQHPYLLCYIDPTLYILNSENKNILVSFEKKWIQRIMMLEGRYAYNEVNLFGICKAPANQSSYLFTADMEKMPIYGIQVSQLQGAANSVCQTKDGRIFIGQNNIVSEYDLGKRKGKIFKTYSSQYQVLKILCTPKNSLIVLIGKSSKLNLEKKTETPQIKGTLDSESFFQVFSLE